MAYPSGVQLSTLTFNSPLTYLGNPVSRTEITVQVSAGVVWAATGDPINDAATTVALGPGVPGAVTFPAVNQPGFTDQAGTATTMWSYIVTRKLFFGSASQSTQKNWQPLTGQATTDFDALPGQDGGGPTYPPAFPVTSVAGQTGVVDSVALAGVLSPLLTGKLDASQKGAPSGVASLGADSKVPDASLPAASNAAAVAGKVSKGELVINLLDYNPPLDGTSDASAAFANAFAAANTAFYKIATILIPPLTFNLLSRVRLPSNVRILAYGATLTKTSATNGYAFFWTGSDGNKGYGSGNSNIIWEGGRFLGSFADTTGRCAFALHHTDNFEVKYAIFEQMQAQGHIMDLAGCSAIRVRSCTFLGFNAAAGNFARDEAIQPDVSDSGAVSAPDAVGSFDGLLTKDVTVEDCKFLPLTVGGTTYPAPNPFGAHSIQEGKTFKRMRFLRNYVLDPRVDTTTDYKGVVHFIAAVNSQFNDNVFEFTTPSNVATIVLYSTDYGQLAAAGHEATDTYAPATFTPGVACDNVEVFRNTFINYAATNGESVIWVTPLSGHGNTKAGLVKVAGNKAKFGAGSAAASNFLKVAYAEHLIVDGGNDLNGPFRGVDVASVDLVDVGQNRHISPRTDAWRFDIVAALRLQCLNVTSAAGTSVYVSNSQHVRLGNFTAASLAGSRAVALNNCSNFAVWEADVTAPSGTKGIEAYTGSAQGRVYNSTIAGGTTTHVDISTVTANQVTETGNLKL